MRFRNYILFSILIIFGCSNCTVQAQIEKEMEPIPYHQIPEAPENFEAPNVVSRMIDGLGYRFYWASKDLREEDIDYKPSEDSRTTRQTTEHMLGLSKGILNAIEKKANVRSSEETKPSFEEQRKQILQNLKKASDILRSSKMKDLSEFKIIFKRGDRESSFPFWNILNGQLSDAIYHTGQIVAFRRASGNPLHPGVSVFSGKTKE